MNPVNHATFNIKGDTIVSCDSLGVVKIWDVRKVAVTESHDFGPYSANSVTFSPLSKYSYFYLVQFNLFISN